MCTFKTNSIAKKTCFIGSYSAFPYEEGLATVALLWLSGRCRGVQILDAWLALDGTDALDAWGTLDSAGVSRVWTGQSYFTLKAAFKG